MTAPTEEEILARLCANPAMKDFIDLLQAKGWDLDYEIQASDGEDWIFLFTRVCVNCKLPTVSDGALVNERDRIKIQAYCKECIASVEDQTPN